MEENIIRASIIISLTFAVIAMLMLSEKFRNKIFKHTGIIAFSVWVLGVVLYMIGFNTGGSKDNILILFLRAALSSIEMFASHSDLLEVDHQLHDEPWYMLTFSVVHFMAAFTTSILLVNLFGIRIKNWWRKLWLWHNKAKETYIFWGINKESLTLSEEISGKGKNIVFIVDDFTNSSHNDNIGHHFSFSKLLGVSSAYDKETAEIIETHKGIVQWQKGSFKLSSKFTQSKETHILFLSNNEDDNIANCTNIKNSNTFNNTSVKYYCHAHRSLENRRIAESLDIRLVDSSFLSILELKQKGEAHPVNFVDLEKDNNQNNTGIVTSSFNALILGFGDTGQEALSFLYEFSAFLGKDGSRSPYDITIIDSNINNLIGNYLANRPALKTNTNIKFIQSAIGSEGYWNNIDSLITKGLNYVIIALGNDQLNLSTAIRLREYQMRFAPSANVTGSSNSIIYVRQNQGLNQNIEKLYNGTIKPFGARETIFSHKFILNQEYKNKAEKYEEQYNAIKAKYIENYQIKEEANGSVKKTEIENIRKKYRIKTQNLSNAYHSHTIIKLLGNNRIKELSEYERIPKNVKDFTGKYSYIHKDGKHPINEEVTTLMTNVAQCEHLRWNAAIEMLGYTQNKEDRSSCNMTTMQHNCLTSWDDLTNIWKELNGKKQYCEYKQYDFNVVETTISLNKI